jgi:2-methylcitrate dehydratase PrpD
VRLAAFGPEALSDPATRALMQRIDALIDAELDAAFPAQRAARVVLETHDGRSHSVLQPTRKGDPETPLSDRELEAKFLELALPVLGDAPARALLERLWRLEREAGVRIV